MQINPIGWFEIPVEDLDRAIKFYETALGFDMTPKDMGGVKTAWFIHDPEGYGATGMLIHMPEMTQPRDNGTLVYFTAKSGDVANEAEKVEEAGGKVIVPKKSIGEHGFIAVCLDSEGNRIALHSLK